MTIPKPTGVRALTVRELNTLHLYAICGITIELRKPRRPSPVHSRLEALGLLGVDEGRLRATPLGRRVATEQGLR